MSITGDGTPQFRINGGTWGTTGNITDGQTLELRLTSNAANSTLNSATVTVGTVSDQWDVTTTIVNSCPGVPSGGDEGCIMPDGSVYAGESPDGNVAMYTTPADAGQFRWNDNSTNYVDTAMSNCGTDSPGGSGTCDTGAFNTAFLVSLNGTGSPAPYGAAEHCEGLTAHGHSDWYLPAQNEAHEQYTNRVAIGGFASASYWTSSESSNNNGRTMNFDSGNNSNRDKDDNYRIRCVRTGVALDYTPTAFNFTDQTGVAVSTQITSNTLSISGITGPTSVSVTGDGSPQIRIGSGAWATSGTIFNGQNLRVRLTSNAANNTMNSATVTVGTVSDQWDVTTTNDCPITPSGGDEGCIMPDGAVYAGTTVGGARLFAARCDVGQSWDGAVCTGTRSALEWKTSSTVTAGTGSVTDGVANTDAMAVAGLAAHPAAQACRNLGAAWYLPALDELDELYTNLGDDDGGAVTPGDSFQFDISGALPAGRYWASSERNFSSSWNQNFSSGIRFFNIKDNDRSVRCVRNDTPLDTTPVAFDFTDQTGVAVSTQITSNSLTISGINTATAISITGAGSPQFRINGGTWGTTGNITDGQSLELRLTSNAAINTISSATVTVGTVSDQWDVTAGNICPATPSGGNEGCVMPDGAVYAGTTVGGVNIYAARCDIGQSWDGTACTGTRSGLQWKTSDTDTVGTNTSDGVTNTDAMAFAGLAAHPAAQACRNLGAAWFLPAGRELDELYENLADDGVSAVTPGESFEFDRSGSFPAGRYWSSTQTAFNDAEAIPFSTGFVMFTNRLSSLSVRCVRN